MNYYGVNGRTGKRFDDSFSRGQSIAFPLDQVVPGFSKGLQGQHQGSRVLIAMPGSGRLRRQRRQPARPASTSATRSLFVVDIVAVPLTAPGRYGGHAQGRPPDRHRDPTASRS